ncbi:MAG: oligosaccharide flippase family protein [Clostridiaceae bacterium]|nr:oligosaccharide flippase family protein [Clostridiaceae bacterium]
MKKQSIEVNFIFQIIYQAVILVLPLVISPIVTRTLGDKALGTYSYVNSIAYYFVIFANLGITRYGQRIISTNKDDIQKLRRIFWSLFTTHMVISLLSISAYAFFVIFFVSEDQCIFLINILYVVSALFDLTWLFYGLENFKNVVVKNLLVRIMMFLLIVFFIKSPSDLWIYTFFETGTLLVGNLLLIPTAIKEIPFARFTTKDCCLHIKPLIMLSISVIAIALYTIFDKTLLGIMSTKENVAYYEYSNKIISIPKMFVGVVGTVIFPRACELASKGNSQGQKRYANYAFFAVSIIGFASVFGLLGISDLFAIKYFGSAFSVCGGIISSMTPLIVLIGMGEVIRSVFLIPMGKDIIYVFMTCMNAFINLTLSIALIPYWGVYGAVTGTTAAEVSFFVLLLIYCGKQLDIPYLAKSIIAFLCIGLFMFIVIRLIDPLMDRSIKTLFVEVIIGVFIYIPLSLVSIRIWFRDIWELVLNIVKKHKKKPR